MPETLTRQCGSDRDHEPHDWRGTKSGGFTLPPHACGGVDWRCPGPITDPEVIALRDSINSGTGMPFNGRLAQRALAAVREAFPEGGFDPDSEDDQTAVGRAMRRDDRPEVGPISRSIARRTMRALADGALEPKADDR